MLTQSNSLITFGTQLKTALCADLSFNLSVIDFKRKDDRYVALQLALMVILGS